MVRERSEPRVPNSEDPAGVTGQWKTTMNNTFLHANRPAVHVSNLSAPSRPTLAMWCTGALTLAVAVGRAADAPAPPGTSTISLRAPETKVTGTARDAQGQPVAGVRVTEYQTDRAPSARKSPGLS